MATEATPSGERIQKAFEELVSHKTLIENCTFLWKKLSDHFSSLEQSLAQRSQDLDSKLQALDSQTAQSLEAIAERESSIPSLESAAAALVEHRRDTAISELESPPAGASSDLKGSLRRYCRRMDSVGLWRFMVARRKELVVLRKEVTDAVAGSVDPVRLVLDAVEDFVDHHEETAGAPPSGSGGADRFWVCGMLLRGLFGEDGKKAPEVSRSIRERAGALVEAWKRKADERGEGGAMGGSEAQIFLQFVVAFGVPSRVEEEFLKKLVLEFASRKEIAKLVTGLGFGEKLGDIIDELIKAGKEIEAVYFAHESGLTERFSPVSLLKSHLQNSKKNATAILKNGNHSAAATEESSTLELNSLRSIIKCVEVLKLESEFSVNGLRKRISVLEKAKSDRKKAAAASKSQNKRARAEGSSAYYRPMKVTRTPNFPYPSFRQQPPAVHQIPATHHAFNLASQGAYEGPTSAAYGGAYSRSPSVSQHYYAPEDMGAPRGGVPYGVPPVTYSGYDYSAGPPVPTQPSYPQPSYPH